jgi:hypothetical protein
VRGRLPCPLYLLFISFAARGSCCLARRLLFLHLLRLLLIRLHPIGLLRKVLRGRLGCGRRLGCGGRFRCGFGGLFACGGWSATPGLWGFRPRVHDWGVGGGCGWMRMDASEALRMSLLLMTLSRVTDRTGVRGLGIHKIIFLVGLS